MPRVTGDLIELPNNKLLSIDEVAGVLGMSVRTVRRKYVCSGKLKKVRLGGQIRFSPVEVKALIARSCE